MFDFDTETALFYGFIALILIVLTTVAVLLVYSGLFTQIIIKTCKPCLGEVKIAYKFAQGPYKEAGSLFTEVHSLLPHHKTIGVYYDDPRKKEAGKLRYIVGLVVSENGSTIDAEEERILTKAHFKFATLPAVNHAVQTTFPFNSTISIIIAVLRVYPALNEYITRRNLCAHPFIELYNNASSEIVFIGPLEKQDEFYVPEVKTHDETRQYGEDDDDHSSVSWDESASLIRNEPIEGDSDSIGEESNYSLSHDSKISSTLPSPVDSQMPPPMPDESKEIVLENTELATDKENLQLKTEDVKQPNNEEDSDNTDSSFEKIDQKDVNSS